MVVGARRAGASISETTTLLGFSRPTVSRVFREWQLRKKTSSDKDYSGRKRLVNERGERRVARIVRSNRRATTRQITAEFNAGASQSISQRTTRRTLQRMGFSSRRPSRVPLISQKNRKRRLLWAQERRNWSLEEWKKVAWSDESRFLLHHADGRIRIWRKQHEFMDPSCQMTTLQAGGGGTMVWGMFSWSTLGPLISLDITLNSTAYLNIVADHVHSFMATMFPSGDGHFQQDNAPCHRARTVTNWFEEHQSEFSLLPWPAQSPDLNPIEHLWDEVERSFQSLETPPSNLTQLRAAIMSAWVNIPQERYQHLVESMPRRVSAVIRAKGGPTRY